MQSGRLTLTSKHLVFYLNGAEKPAIVIDLDTINSILHEDLLTDHNIMAITYLQYDTTKFSVLDYEKWEQAIETQRMQPHINMQNPSPVQGPQFYK
jgi:hypothetical protein